MAKIMRAPVQVQAIEDAKLHHPTMCLEAFGVLFLADDAGAQLQGLELLRDVANNSWQKLTSAQHQHVWQQMQQWLSVADYAAMVKPVRSQLASASAAVGVATGQQAVAHTVTQLLPQLLQKGASVLPIPSSLDL